jgi:hypothetical protein
MDPDNELEDETPTPLLEEGDCLLMADTFPAIQI